MMRPADDKPSALARGDWLTIGRVKAYCLLASLAFLAMLIATYLNMQATGSDFLAFWSAARIVTDHRAALVYDLGLQAAYQREAGFGNLIAYVNPPAYLPFIEWLGALPYPAAWIAWTATTFGLWLLVCRTEWKGDLTLPLLAFPASYVAASHAQNGFLTSAMLVGGVLAMRRSSFLAGLAFGLLLIKPHLALVVPFWLLACRDWRALAGGLAGGTGLLLLSVLLYGPEPWLQYPRALEVSRSLMAQDSGLFWMRMATPFAALRQHLGMDAAMIGQAAVTLAAIAAVMVFATRVPDRLASGAMALAATPLASPYLFSYDLPFLVLPVFWLIVEGQRRGWLAGEKYCVVALYLAPFVTRALAIPLGVNLMPLASAATMALIWRKAWSEARKARPANEAASSVPGREAIAAS